MAECSGLRVFCEFAVKVSARAAPPEGCTEAGGPASKTAPLTAGKLVLAGGLNGLPQSQWSRRARG